jgi:hypothetical protein
LGQPATERAARDDVLDVAVLNDNCVADQIAPKGAIPPA